MEGYYDHGLRTLLERPLAIIGFMGSGARYVGRALAAVLGLPLEDIDRQVEHGAGMSLAALQLTRGEADRREREHAALARAVRAKPPGVLVLGDGALLDARSRALAQAHLRMVYLARPLGVLHQAILRETARMPERYPEFVLAGVPQRAEWLTPLLSARLPSYALAEHIFEAGSMHPQRISEGLRRELALP